MKNRTLFIYDLCRLCKGYRKFESATTLNQKYLVTVHLQIAKTHVVTKVQRIITHFVMQVWP